MKKILLSLIAMAGLAFAAPAETVTFVPEGSSFSGTATTIIPGGNCVGVDYTAGNITMQIEKINSSTSNVTGGMLRWYQNDKLHITATAGTTIESIVIYAPKSYSNNGSAVVSATNADPATFTNTVADEEKITWTGTASGEVVVSATKQVRFTALEITYTVGEGPVVEAPFITCENNKVTITATDADAIYYTTDESVPTTTSTKYTAPFDITATTTVKAIAVKGDASSLVSTFVATYVGNFADFAAFIKDGGTGTVDGPITAIYQNGRNLYLKDANGGFILSYNSNNIEVPATVNGDVFASVTGAYKSQNGLPEIIPSAFGAKSTGTAVDPEVITIEELSADMVNAYVKLENVKIVAGSRANNYDITDATGSAVLYNTFYNATYYDAVQVPEGEGFTIEGFVSLYNSTVQITPIAITGGKVMETVATPVFSVEQGAVTAGTTVSITTATEGADIYVTLDGTVPTAASVKYTEPIVINAPVTIKAIAVKEGMIDSDVATATYSIVDPNATTATFDFTDVTTLSPAVEVPANGSGTSVAGMTFTAAGVTMTIGDAATSNPPRIWAATGAQEGSLDFRMYKGDTFTLAAPAQKYIATIEFTKTGGSFAMTPDNGELALNGNNATWTPAADTKPAAVKFDATSTTRISTIVVTLADSQSAVNDIEIEATDAPAEYYNLQGVRVANPAQGLYIVRQGNKTYKVLVK